MKKIEQDHSIEELSFRADNKETYWKSLWYPLKLESKFFKNKIFVGRLIENKEKFYIECDESFHSLLIGITGCMPSSTKVLTPTGFKSINKLKKIDEIYSYNFVKKKIEKDICLKIDSGIKELIEINTDEGKVLCSPDHVFFISNGKKIIIKKAKDLTRKDCLIKLS